MRYWWVNQNQTYVHEVGGSYLWSTKFGDVVFSFCDTYIKVIGVVNGVCESASKPTEFRTTCEYWANEGWYLPVRFTGINQPIGPKDHKSVGD